MSFKWSEEQFLDLQSRRVAQMARDRPCVVDQLRATLPAPRGVSKYKVSKTELDGITFATRSESIRYAELLLRQAAGEIRNVRRQVAYILAPAVKLAFRKKVSPALRYTADAVYEVCATGRTVVEDVKPQGTTDKELERDFVMRCHLMKSVHGLDVTVVRVGK